MIFNIGICLILVIGFLRGFHRGLVVALFNLVGWLAATVSAILFTAPLVDFVLQIDPNWSPNATIRLIIKWLAFLLIFITISSLVRIVRDLIRPVTKLPLISQANAILGALMNLISHYLLIFILLNFLLLLPSQTIQQQYDQSTLSQWIVKQTPGLSNKMIQIWTEHASEVNA
ncbi:bacteriocin transporter [Lentilactobacillus fungorum]|uniref:Bacteriocin transporter n=1 Tax=Lentilactobacillus fungorum TaxID=2201250 RepID=A0ABQ3VUS2_9LACO|nr:CvpA family protein [Lentilactobacillus fungorum]GHP12633.1 bacteriocin transporter [Lentilactobacillus fungorum]